MRSRLALAAALGTAFLLALTGVAAARDPHRWKLTARHTIPVRYYQGMAADGRGSLWFDGPEVGLYRTDDRLHERAGVADAIPAAVAATQKYNHIGDIAYDPTGGGRVLLPMECYDPSASPTNCAGTGAIGVADPRTLAWRYDVTLADLPKAMWCEVSPDHRLLWTSAGDDLLAYRLADISRAHAFPAAPVHPVRRLRGAVPPSGITGAVFYGGRLFLAGSQDRTYQVWSVDVRTGTRRLEIERTIVGESEGLAVVDALGGALHWMIQPIPDGQTPPTYPVSTILSFTPRAQLRHERAVRRLAARARREQRRARRV